MAWIEYNPNPRRNRVGDCAIRAIAKATDQDWEMAYKGLYVKGYSKGDSEFLKAVYGRKADKAWKLIDELVEAVKILHPRMYTTFIDKVQDL